MLASPDFEEDFYIAQNKAMCERYAKRFKKWKTPWKPYIDDVRKRLRGRHYWLWSYLAGFEKFLQENQHSTPTQAALDTDKDGRISRIIGDFYKVENYVRQL
jgi:hypothetical protein